MAFDRFKPIWKQIWSHNLLASYSLFFVAAAAPFPFGSTNNLAIGFWCVLLSIAVVFLSPRKLKPPQRWLICGIFVIIAGYGFVLHEQLSDRPWVAPFHPVWKRAAELLGTPLAPSASIVKNLPFFALGATLANILALLLGVVIGSERVRARQLLWIIAVSGALYAVYGVLSLLIEPGMLLWRDKTAYVGTVTGTFVNRNTAATYFGSCSVIWLLLLVQNIQRWMPARQISRKESLRYLSQLPLRKFLPIFTALLTCLTAMFLTQSRAGVALSLLAMIAAFTVYFGARLPSRSGVWITLLVGIIVSLGLLEFLGGRVSNRFDSQGLVDEGRIEAWRSALHIIKDYPWFGTGLGTFVWSFPPYRSPDISIMGIWDAAHSTPLELASEVGLPLTFMVAVGWIVMLAVLVRGVKTRRRDKMLPLSALCIALLALLHSTIDFTLQVPGYTLPFFALFGAGLAQSFHSVNSKE